MGHGLSVESQFRSESGSRGPTRKGGPGSRKVTWAAGRVSRSGSVRLRRADNMEGRLGNASWAGGPGAQPGAGTFATGIPDGLVDGLGRGHKRTSDNAWVAARR